MSKALAERVDVSLLALQGARVEQEYRLARFTRLAGSLLADTGSATARFVFQQVEGMPAVTATVGTTVQLRCQRCLQPCGCELESTSSIVFTADEAEEARVPEGWEAIAADPRRVALAELVEDELLLSLPLVPMHADAADCGLAVALVAAPAGPETAPVQDPGTTTQRPFAKLAELLKQ